MTQLWVRLMRRHRIVESRTLPMPDEDISATLEEACRQLDVPKPLWLSKHEREYAEAFRTTFLPDHFLESVPFDRMEIERIDPDMPKAGARNPLSEA